jgi:hypothetical protein
MYTAIDKFKIIQYFDKHGYQATLDSLLLSGFKVSRRTIFNWKKKYIESYDNLYELSDKSRRPKKYRQSNINTNPNPETKYNPLGLYFCF